MLREARPMFETALAVGSEGDDSRNLALSHGWEYLEHRNVPLSDKIAAGMKALRGRCDAVMVLGSDDFISPEACAAAREAMSSSPFFGFTDFSFITYGPRALYLPGYVGARAGETLGAGRTLSAAILDAVEWSPWPSGLHRSLDLNMTRIISPLVGRFGAPKAVRMAETGGRIMDVKAENNICAFNSYYGVATRADPEELLASFRPELRADLLPILLKPPARPAAVPNRVYKDPPRRPKQPPPPARRPHRGPPHHTR